MGKEKHIPIKLNQCPHRVLAFFDKARLIDDQDAIGLPHLVRDEAMIRLTHRVLIPHIIAHAALHAPNIAPLDLEGHGLDGFAFACAALADHVVEEMLAGLAPRKTPPELVMERLEFVKKSVDITWGEIKLRDGEPLAFGSMCR